MDGRIVEVMECWPLELVVDTDNGRQMIGLTDSTEVRRAGESLEPGTLAPGLAVRIRIVPSSRKPNAALAESIEILP